MGEVIRSSTAVTVSNVVKVRPDTAVPTVYVPRRETLVANVAKRMVYPNAAREDVLMAFQNAGPMFFGYGNYPTLTPDTSQTPPLPPWDGEMKNCMQFTDPHSQFEIWAVSTEDAIVDITESMRAA